MPDALARAVGLYEGVKVNVNHPKGHPRRRGITRNELG